MYHPVFLLQETSDKPLYTFTVTIHYWSRVKMDIPLVDPDSSHNTPLFPLLFSHPTPTPTPDSTFLLSSDPIPIHFILLRILVSTLYIQLLLQVQQLYSIYLLSLHGVVILYDCLALPPSRPVFPSATETVK